MSNVIDMSVTIKRYPETQNYQLNLLIIKDNNPAQFETHICQSMVEIFELIQKFEKKYLSIFENQIEYEQVDWRELARQNREVQGVKK